MSDRDTANAPDHVTEFGAKLRAARKARQLTQDDLAVLIGFSRATVAMVESGKMFTFNDPNVYALIASHVGGTPAYWQDLAERSRPFFKLVGVEGSEEHSRTALFLEQHWTDLSPAALRAIKAAAQHDLTKSGKLDK